MDDHVSSDEDTRENVLQKIDEPNVTGEGKGILDGGADTKGRNIEDANDLLSAGSTHKMSSGGDEGKSHHGNSKNSTVYSEGTDSDPVNTSTAQEEIHAINKTAQVQEEPGSKKISGTTAKTQIKSTIIPGVTDENADPVSIRAAQKEIHTINTTAQVQEEPGSKKISGTTAKTQIKSTIIPGGTDENGDPINTRAASTTAQLEDLGSKKMPGTATKTPIKSNVSEFVLLLLVSFIVAVIAYVTYGGDYFGSHHNYNSVDIFKERLKDMKTDFPNQNELMWNMLRNGGSRHLKKVFSGNNKEVLTPLSYLIAGYAGSGKTVDCFVSKLAAAYTKKYLGSQVLNSRNFSGGNDKGKLVNAITSRLNHTKLIVMKDIDKLHFKVAQLFMSYADEHNKVASYPQSVLLLTTVLPFSYNPAQSRHLDEGNAGKHFRTTVWHGVHPDKSAPLWSRVGDGLILIRKEEKHPCKD